MQRKKESTSAHHISRSSSNISSSFLFFWSTIIQVTCPPCATGGDALYNQITVMDFDNNEPFQVIYRVGCLSSSSSLCSSGVYYGGRMPNPAYILVNGVHCCTLYRWRLCFGYLSFRVYLNTLFRYCSPLIIIEMQWKMQARIRGIIFGSGAWRVLTGITFYS